MTRTIPAATEKVIHVSTAASSHAVEYNEFGNSPQSFDILRMNVVNGLRSFEPWRGAS
jgi:hypothetical protein